VTLSPLGAATFSRGALKGSFDSTLSLGGIYRLDDPDRDFYGVANGGRQNSVNTDDGNLNYRKGWASWVAKGTHDLELQYGDHLGAFARVTYFYDYENERNDRSRTPLTDEARDRVGRRIDYLDLYGLWRGEIAGRPVDVRFGRQVLNLGESTFIPNGINVVNPVDVAKLRTPGAELREALLPSRCSRPVSGSPKMSPWSRSGCWNSGASRSTPPDPTFPTTTLRPGAVAMSTSDSAHSVIKRISAASRATSIARVIIQPIRSHGTHSRPRTQ